MKLTKAAQSLKENERLCPRCAGSGCWVEKDRICFRCNGAGTARAALDRDASE